MEEKMNEMGEEMRDMMDETMPNSPAMMPLMHP
jgi:hypothetical protein